MIYFDCAISEYPKVGPLNVSALLVPNPASGPGAQKKTSYVLLVSLKRIQLRGFVYALHTNRKFSVCEC